MPPLEPARGAGVYVLALALAALAGWVDAIGLSCWHGLYVSFMSGNSTALGASIHQLQGAPMLQLAGVIASFVGGVVAGELVFHATGRRSCSHVLVLEAILLGAAVIANGMAVPSLMPALILALAMGLQNAAVHRAGGISVALTYVTGTLVHFGRAIAGALTGTSSMKEGWPYLGLWVALVAGAALGAWAVVGLGAAWAIGIAALAAVCLAFLPPARPAS